MSAYASLPGSFMPPFFAFGGVSSTASGIESDDDAGEIAVGNGAAAGGAGAVSQSQPHAPPSPLAAGAQPEATLKMAPAASPSSYSSRDASSSDDAATRPPSAQSALPSSTAAASRPSSSPPSSSSSSGIIIAFLSARVDPVALIRRLTSGGGSIARRTANFIARKPAGDGGGASGSEGEQGVGEYAGDQTVGTHAEGRGDCLGTASLVYGTGSCHEDTDSDEELSFYNYSDDFSTSDGDAQSDVRREDRGLSDSGSDGDPSAIEFKLSITFHGRAYSATRTFPTFVKLRDDLLREEAECARTVPGRRRDGYDGGAGDGDVASVPELPRVSPESLERGGGHGALYGAAHGGFALLQAMAQRYCPEMECWMRQVIEAFPCSQSLSSFLWEPLSSSGSGWECIGEEKGFGSENDCYDCGSHRLSNNSEPSLRSRYKPEQNGFQKIKRVKSKGSMCSLDSIDEGDGYGWDDNSV